jgi:hypothetical protein
VAVVCIEVRQQARQAVNQEQEQGRHIHGLRMAKTERGGHSRGAYRRPAGGQTIRGVIVKAGLNLWFAKRSRRERSA